MPRLLFGALFTDSPKPGKSLGQAATDDLGETTNTYSPILDVSGEVYLWGHLRAGRDSLQAETLA